jgi:hypothetical protein
MCDVTCVTCLNVYLGKELHSHCPCLLTSLHLTPPTDAPACYLSLPYFAFTQQAERLAECGRQL